MANTIEVWKDNYRKYWVVSVYDKNHNEIYYEEYHYKKDAIAAGERLSKEDLTMIYMYDDMEFETREQAEEYIRDNSLDAFRDVLDECSDRIIILGMHFLPSRVLEELDPVAFDCEYSAFCDNLYDYIEEVEE